MVTPARILASPVIGPVRVASPFSDTSLSADPGEKNPRFHTFTDSLNKWLLLSYPIPSTEPGTEDTWRSKTRHDFYFHGFII